MNKAITEGLVLSPPAFAAGLNVWSRQDGLAGSDTYAGSGNAAIVAADQDFGSCVEMAKTDGTQKVRWMGNTPIYPGCYYRVTVRIKAVSGNLPRVRAAATAVRADGSVISGLGSSGPETGLTAYGRVETVSLILGTGERGGVDLAWDASAAYAHVGLDLLGPKGGVVRIDDIEVEDVTGAFLRDMLDWVDVRDYGAKGDGTTDDTAAFAAADADAQGRSVLVSKGVFRLDDHVTFNSPVRFEGRVVMPRSKRLSLVKNFELNSYAAAFGNEEEGLRRGIQALFNFTDHDTFDLKGRRVELSEPLDVQAAVYDKTTYANQRSIRNGQLDIRDTPAFDTTRVTGSCDFDPANPRELTNVANIASIAVGSHVSGPKGVGREVYVAAKNVSTQTLTLNVALWGAPARQTYTFDRFKYALDFSGFDQLLRFTLQDIEFLMADRSSGILLPPAGLIFHVKDCYFTGPKDRGITSHAAGCQGMLIDRCQFLSSEQQKDVAERHTIGFNVNTNDTKIRNNRAVKFKHWAVMGGSGHIITGNHFFQGDNDTLGQRTAGIVFAEAQAKTVFSANYVDNCYLEWTNEHDGAPDFLSEFSFGGLQIVGNIIFSSNVPSSYCPLHIKPFGKDHWINGMTVTGNNFKTIRGQSLDRVDFVDTTHADLDYGRFTDVNVHSNTFQAVAKQFQNPITVPVQVNTPSSTWEVDLSAYMPFRGEAKVVTAVMPDGQVRKGDNGKVWTMPYATGRIGGSRQSVRINWSDSVKGRVFVTARCDAPT
ncbi:glycosyl hydrolase family 28-related protein [Jannaschia rubra]|uniref:Pectate lyase superfamily protein n=1 Tax=Jannaschia rubra TaxID=282197 RepID=A0A0M6XTU9_9RHOB|nr:glycosyl hydrolase family 28-related protein [Jannaschia rubra]CTQ33394.1 Pectate lyase superfamily protein [Jannaschia rubra]SFG00730.1 Pectate lyase superfamily protein [Jannaschia rubra]